MVHPLSMSTIMLQSMWTSPREATRIPLYFLVNGAITTKMEPVETTTTTMVSPTQANPSTKQKFPSLEMQQVPMARAATTTFSSTPTTLF